MGNISIDGSENQETITIGKGDNNVIVNNTGLTIKDGPSVTKNGINAGNKKLRTLRMLPKTAMRLTTSS